MKIKLTSIAVLAFGCALLAGPGCAGDDDEGDRGGGLDAGARDAGAAGAGGRQGMDAGGSGGGPGPGVDAASGEADADTTLDATAVESGIDAGDGGADGGDAGPDPDPVQCIHIGSRRELFVDHLLVESLTGAELVLQTPTDEGPVFDFDQPWEGMASVYTTVIKDGDKFLLYYRGQPTESASSSVTCYAESTDGTSWVRPNLGLHQVSGTFDNNVILTDAVRDDSFAPFIDTNPDAPPEERFKATASGSGSPTGTLVGFTSADGINWTNSEGTIMSGFDYDSLNVAFYSEVEQQYVCYFRDWFDGIRRIRRAVSRDFSTLYDQGLMQYAYPGAAPSGYEHHYLNGTHPYFRAPHIYIALAGRFIDGDTESDAVFMSSRAGSLVYDRTFTDRLVVPAAEIGTQLARSNFPAENSVQTGPRELSFYLGHNYRTAQNHLRRYSLRLDGFSAVSPTAAGTAGELLTRPLTFTGDRLQLNYLTRGNGELKVEIQDAERTPIEGYAIDDFEPLTGDEIDAIASWQSGSDLSALQGRPVRLRFVLQDADLFSLKFILPEPTVAVSGAIVWPNLTRLDDGSILLAGFDQSSHGQVAGDTAGWRSQDEGESFGFLSRITDHEPQTARFNHALGLSADGDVIALVGGWTDVQQPGEDKKDPFRDAILRPWIMRSTDDGNSWQKLGDLITDSAGRELVPFGDIIVSPDGRLNVSAYSTDIWNEPGPWAAYFLTSDDHGQSWEIRSLIAEDHNETALLDLGGGEWLAHGRSSAIDQYRSLDDGLSWQHEGAVTLASQRPGHLLQLDDGSILMTYGDRRPDHLAVRARTSQDKGLNWSAPIFLAALPDSDGGYPSSLQRTDGLILTVFYVKEPGGYSAQSLIWSRPPACFITSPADGAELDAPVDLTITANATDALESVRRVEFRAGGELLGQDDTAPYTYTWSDVPPGRHALEARAIYRSGAVAVSAPATVTVRPDGAIDLASLYGGGQISVSTDMTWTTGTHPEVGVAGPFDGSTDYWHAAFQGDASVPSQYTIALDQTYGIETLGICLKPGYAESAEIYFSLDGSSWGSPVKSYTSIILDSVDYTVFDPPLDATQVRVVVTAADGWPGLNEIELYGAPL